MSGRYIRFRTVSQLAVAVLLLHTLSAEGWSQLVIVRPGYVKAPFVRVYRNFDGSSTVRAPFVHVNPRPRYYGPSVGTAVQQSSDATSPEELRSFTWRRLRQSIRNSVTGLNNQLSRLPTGRVWQAHFKTNAILAAMGADNDIPPSANERSEVAAILVVFDQAQSNSDLQAVTSLRDFRTLHAGLRLYVQPAALRLRRQLSSTGQQLHRALAAFDTVDQWRQFLLTDFYAFDQPAASPPPSSRQGAQTVVPCAVAPGSNSPALVSSTDESGVTASPDILLKMLNRYDDVATNARYPMIARLSAFQAMHRQLRDFASLPSQQQQEPRVEELPPPTPTPAKRKSP